MTICVRECTTYSASFEPAGAAMAGAALGGPSVPAPPSAEAFPLGVRHAVILDWHTFQLFSSPPCWLGWDLRLTMQMSAGGKSPRQPLQGPAALLAAEGAHGEGVAGVGEAQAAA